MIIKIVQQNIWKENQKVGKLMDVLLAKEPQILLFSEFCYSKHKENLVNQLEIENYQIIMPYAYKEDRDRNKYCTCMMAVKEGIKFFPRTRKYITLDLRYIEGKLDLGDGEILEILYVYVPQTYRNSKDRVEKKAEMLFATYCFWNEYKDKNVFIGGDFNTEINGTTSCENIFRATYDEANDTDTHEPTWGDKCLDYALVSNSLVGCKTTRLKTTSDHIALITELAI